MAQYDKSKSPASKLEGIGLVGGWMVKERLEQTPSQTGSAYSICYYVEKDGKSYFLKAYDLNAYLKGDADASRRFKEMGRMLNQYIHEKSLSQFCRDGGATNVAYIVEADVTSLSDDPTLIPYLIFERADGDVRKFLESVDNVEIAWKFKSLHEVAVGLQQLHRLKIYHQDIKPSNILTYDGDSKVGDLGRAVRDLSECPFFEDRYWGDKTYLAPEVAYTSEIGKDERRMWLTDLYLLGSLITYYFFHIPYNGMLYNQIPESHHYLHTSLTYSEMLEELKEAHVKCMEKFKRNLDLGDRDSEEKLIQLIDGLCNPDIEYRQHPFVRITSSANGGRDLTVDGRYGLEKVISSLDLLQKRFHFKLKK